MGGFIRIPPELSTPNMDLKPGSIAARVFRGLLNSLLKKSLLKAILMKAVQKCQDARLPQS
jgi:hypothetical protein